MADQLSEIRRKVATLAAGMKPPLWSPGAEYARDVPYLLAEVERLTAELERTRQAWVNGEDALCEDVCEIACKSPCGVRS
jgi:hypothetical protein